MLATPFHDSIARDRQRALRAAGAQRSARPRQPARRHAVEPVSIRWAGPADIPALDALARLDSSRVPEAPVLVAERGERIVAALPLASGARAIADPFERTAELVDLLELRAAQLLRPDRPARRGRGRAEHGLLARRAV